uniref:inorganic diphosphatase n=1 Tax=Tetraselmis sp. GSL018 TaxID=582737 RepID=A0A061RXK1_9CHLO
MVVSNGAAHKHHVPYHDRVLNPVETAVESQWNAGEQLLKELAVTEDVHGFRPEISGSVFCGHLVADLDSIAGAIGAATLYGGTPARASEINSETEFALEYWGVSLDEIRPIEDVLAESPGRGVCLVDFQQTTQLNPAIKMDQIVGVIDHHALQSSTIVTNKPIFVDIRPWGSMSTILAYEFATSHAFLPKRVAGLLLCAILSDTLNLRSPTTTDWDRRVVSMLVQYTGVEDVNLLCSNQFKAKSKTLAQMTPYTLVNGDIKQFKFGGSDGSDHQIAFSVVETTDMEAMIRRTEELIPEMRTVKSELGEAEDKPPVDALFTAIVDIVNLESYLLVQGQAEQSLAETAYGGKVGDVDDNIQAWAGEHGSSYLLYLGSRVSRKADFVPPLSDAVAKGWMKPLRKNKSEAAFRPNGPVHMDYSHNPAGELSRGDEL